MLDYLINALATLFITLDPPGLAPIFLAVTAGVGAAERTQVAKRSVVVATCTLIFFAISGETLLKLLGITISAFRISGGLLLFFIAYEMVFAKRTERKQNAAGHPHVHTTEELHTMAIFPLAIPLIAGPGAISATIITASNAPNYLAVFLLILLIIAIAASCYAVFLVADRIDRVLGATGRIVVERLLGLILSALAVQFVADGIRAMTHTP